MFCSIGYVREDNEFVILATLNTPSPDRAKCEAIAEVLRLAVASENPGEDVVILERQDTPETVTLDDGEIEGAA